MSLEKRRFLRVVVFGAWSNPSIPIPGLKRLNLVIRAVTCPTTTYEEVCTGTTGHTEAVRITFDPAQVSYQELVEIYWHQTDPTDASGPISRPGGIITGR